MKYSKVLNLWQEGVQEDIVSGQIKLQRGQWLRCGESDKPCRYVGLSRSNSIWVTHWQGNSKATLEKFMSAAVLQQQRETL
jgi:hypothetical protein